LPFRCARKKSQASRWDTWLMKAGRYHERRMREDWATRQLWCEAEREWHRWNMDEPCANFRVRQKIDVAAPQTTDIPLQASGERVSSGFLGLDSMLSGGLFRGSSALITGAPGTAKTTLAGSIANFCGLGAPPFIKGA